MSEKGLGIGFDQLMDSDLLIDTETGAVITDKNIPDEGDANSDTKEKKQQDDKSDMIEVETIEEGGRQTGSQDDPAGSPAQGKSSSSTNQDQNVLNSLAKALYEKGVISELDEEKLKSANPEDAEVLIDLIKGEIDRNVDGYKKGLPDKLQKLIENYEENVPLDVIIGLESTKIRLDNISEENVKEDEELAKILIEENYRRQGISDAKIKKRIQQFDDLGQLQDEGVDALNESKEYFSKSIEDEKTKATKAKADAEENRTKTLKSLKESIDGTEQIIEGLKLTAKEKETIYDSMTKVVDKDKSGNPMNAVMMTRAKNPMGFEKLLHYYHNLGLFNIDDDGKLTPDVSKIKAGAKTSAIDELNSALRKGQPSFAGSPAREPSANNETLKANIEAMKGIIKS